MSHCGYFVKTLILVTSGLLSIGSSMEQKICFSVSNQHTCYFQSKGGRASKQWETARDICQENSATLPIIENQEVQKTFEEYLRNISLNTDGVWLGGRQEAIKKEWQWSNKKPFSQPHLIMVAGDENSKNQAVIRTSDSVSPSNVTIEYRAVYPTWPCNYICQYSASRCPTGNSTTQNEHHGCLKVFHDPKLKAVEATKECNKTGGHLAIFDGDEFLTKAPKVYQQIQQYRSQDYICYYIGLHRIDTKSWFWMRSNNENSTIEGNYDNWRDRNNRANGDCLFATANDHRWEASNCFAWERFICQTIEKQATEKATTQEPSATNTSASTTTNSIPGISSATATTARNSPTTTATIAATTSKHKDVSSATVAAAIGSGVVIVILCIIVILVVVVMRRKSKSSNNKTEPAEIDSETKDKKTKENPSTTTTEERRIYGFYADIPLAEKSANDMVEGGQNGIVYSSMDFNQGVTYAQMSTFKPVYTNTQNVTGPIYAEP